MVRLFGLKLGSDKKKKAAEAQAQLQQYRRLNPNASEHNSSWRSQREEALMSSIGRNLGSETPYAGSVISLVEPGPFTTSGLNPSSPLRTLKSEANLAGLSGLRNANMSSSSLALPPTLFGGDDEGRLGSRPGTAQSIHSVRSIGGGWRSASKLSNLRAGNLSSTSLVLPPDLAGDNARSPSGSRPGSAQSNRADPTGRRPNLDVKTNNLNPPSPSGVSLPSPLGRYELASPVRSDSESLLGDAPGKVADQIASKIVREEKLARAAAAAAAAAGGGGGAVPLSQPRPRQEPGAPEIRPQQQIKAPEPQRKYAGAPRQQSPQARGGEERNLPSFLVPGANANNRMPNAAPAHHHNNNNNNRSIGRGREMGFRDTPQGRISHDWRQKYGLEDDGANHHGPVGANAQEASTTGEITALNSSEAGQVRREHTNAEAPFGAHSHMLNPYEPAREASVPGPAPPRSPLFRQMSPFDGRNDSDEEQNVYHAGRNAANAPYGIPSPPLSHRHQLSDDNSSNNNNNNNKNSGTPVYRAVEAKQDTVLVGGRGRDSLGLQIEKLEKSLHQAQAMSALELKQEATQNRARAESNASSNYSEISERALTFEQPMYSPKPFALSPRPTDSVARPEGSPQATQPTFQISRANSKDQPRQRSVDASMSRTGNTAAAQMGGGAGPRPSPNNSGRPTLGPRAHTGPSRPPPSPGFRNGRPGAEEYGAPFKRPGKSHKVQGSFGQGQSPFAMAAGSEQAKDGLNSDNSTPATSPGLVASYSVFSPPPTGKRFDAPTSQPAKQDWYGPALTSPPTTPLPTPDGTNRTKYFPDSAQQQQQQQQQQHHHHHQQQQQYQQQQPRQPQHGASGVRPELIVDVKPSPMSVSAGLASSPVITPVAAESNWPLPSPNVASFDDNSAAGEAGFSAHRHLQPEKRAPPAPLNLAVAKYTDAHPNHGPWTAGLTVEQPTMHTDLADRRMTTGGHERIVDMYAEGLGESTDYYYYRRRNYYDDGDDGQDSIGVARGPSIRYNDREGDDEEMSRGRTRTRQPMGPSLKQDQPLEEKLHPVMVPAVGDAMAYKLRQPTHGMRSPTGVSDEQGTRFI